MKVAKVVFSVYLWSSSRVVLVREVSIVNVVLRGQKVTALLFFFLLVLFFLVVLSLVYTVSAVLCKDC